MASFSKLLASRLAKQQHSPDVHPEADVLNAFAENLLPPDERQSVLAHLATCPECREVLHLIAPDAPVHTSNKPAWQNLRWPLAAAATLLLTFTVLHHKSPQPVPAISTSHTRPHIDPAPTSSAQPQPAPQTPPIVLKKHLPPSPAIVTPIQAVVEAKPQVASLPAPAPITNLPVPPVPDLQYQKEFSDRSAVLSSDVSAQSFQRRAVSRIAPARRRTVWSLDSKEPGTIRVSDNGGASWATISLNSSATPLSLAVSGSNIWVGAEQGTLFHSIDNGAHFARIPVADGVTELKDAVTAIEAPPGSHTIRLKTPSGSWITANEGQTWHKEPSQTQP